MKKIDDLTFDERIEIETLFATWLSKYTHEVIVKVMKRSEEIINNEFTMNLLKELHTRTQEENRDFAYSIGHLLTDYNGFKEFNPHNHPVTHASSYRDILYDMYIR